MKTGVLIVNLGTPESPAVGDVRKYLREFLMDERVIDIPVVNRFFLVNGLIAPFRAYSSAKAYAKLWTAEGSPLKVYGYKLETLLQQALGGEYVVSLAMRYQQPSIREGLEKIRQAHVARLIVIPLYPQYASASTATTQAAVMKEISRWETIPELHFVPKFFDHPEFIEAFAHNGRRHLQANSYGKIIFSYHGLPERQIKKASRNNYCRINEQCCSRYHQLNEFCYRAQCFETSRLLAKALNIDAKDYIVSFQSRLGKDPWIKPYTDKVIEELAGQGIKNLLVFSPAFVADCLETTVEIGQEYLHLFRQHGGETVTLVESLNDSPAWVRCLASIVKTAAAGSPIAAPLY
jgi:ferrochelatase